MKQFLIAMIIILLLAGAGVAYADGTVNVSITSSADDAEELAAGPFAGSMALDSTELTIGWDGADDRLIGLRFNSVTVPANADIASAYIQFEASSSLAGTIPITIYGQSSVTPITFQSTNYNISNRSTTTAYVVWSPASWTAGASGSAERSSDISTIVEEIVALPSWSAGNSMAFILDATGGGNYREGYAEDGTGTAPALYIEWCDTACPAVSVSSPIEGDEWLNTQDIFSLFLGRWIIIYIGAALAGTVARTFILILWRRPQLVKIAAREGEDE